MQEDGKCQATTMQYIDEFVIYCIHIQDKLYWLYMFYIWIWLKINWQ